MRDYIQEKVKYTTRNFSSGKIKVSEIDPLPETINFPAILLIAKEALKI